MIDIQQLTSLISAFRVETEKKSISPETVGSLMIAIAGHYKFLDKEFCDITAPPFQRVMI